MWKALKQKVWQWRGVIIAVPSVTIAVLGLRSLGLLQALEFPVLDQFFLMRPQEAIDPRIVIVEANEADLQKVGHWPLTDAELANVLQTIKQQKPTAIGLDLYRDLPVEPGNQTLTKLFETTPNLIGVQKVGSSSDSSPVNPPPILKQRDQVGANDFVLDADGKVRRGLFYLEDSKGENVFNFGFLLAAHYLKNQGIEPELTADQTIKLGTAVFPALDAHAGSYVGAQAGGYQVMLTYRGTLQRFQTVTLTDVLERRLPSDVMRDRIVLIGTTAESLKDLFYVPYSSSLTAPTRMAGVTIHANFISQILSATLDGRMPTLKTWNEPLEGLWILAWATTGAILSWRQRYSGKPGFRPWNIVSIIFAASCLVGGSYITFLQGWWIPVVPPILSLFGASIVITGYLAQSAAEMRRTFGRYLTDEVVASLLETPGGLTLGGERRKVTILISDLRGFSAISERLPPEQVVMILNLYLGVMSDTVTRYSGTINDFIGDGVFVMFGAPIYQEDDSERAVACAIAMQTAMVDVNRQNQQLGLPTIEMGIGIHTGEVVVGNIGSQRRAKYTVIGNHVNLAARIESYTVGGQILISDDTFRDVGDIIKVDRQIRVEPKGIKEPITLYNVNGIGGKHNLSLPADKELFIALTPEIPVQYTVLEGKHAVGTIFEGTLVSLSEKSAELRSDHFLTPLSNLKLNLLEPSQDAVAVDDLYAKVLDRPATHPNCVRVRFTGMPIRLAELLPDGSATIDAPRHS
ncbi:adenylate/guanylate cyclase domain-containing protein [Phormidium sp. FACHB-592]|uniref:Adenylate/guanylate cyclase domain-containing protein n=2 Tax=Stenomitos TaxID=1844270 RepID=A0ABV0KRE3_9CYAN|nr:adenylate/guanylate cyclase domain-containing protein [Phormidium sp. FACHB-592]MBD2072839.1 adenylate/guanylate cyclase domain-containing protein [Phormidium sp. FACHB-592]